MSKDVVCHSERSEESVVALSVRLHLLFLPAAGFSHDNGQTQRPNSAGRYAGDSAASGTRQLCPTFDESSVLVGGWNVCRRHSVRLACVVSEGLTQTRKCYIVFGTGCPRLSF